MVTDIRNSRIPNSAELYSKADVERAVREVLSPPWLATLKTAVSSS